jgi:hypothetical protein
MPEGLSLNTYQRESVNFTLDFLSKLQLKQLKLILQIDKSELQVWDRNVSDVIDLNAKYPLAIFPITCSRIVIRRHYFHDWNKTPTIYTEENIRLLPRKSIKKILSVEVRQLELSQQVNSFIADLDYTVDICSYNAKQIKESICSNPNRDPAEEAKLKRNPFERFSGPFKLDVFEFAFRLRLNGHDCFYHFTDRSNIASIVKNGGLYSWSALNQLQIDSKMGGDDFSHRLDVQKGLQDYVRLGITSDHPMMYRLEEMGYDLVILCVHPIVAMFEGTLFSNINATDRGCIVGGEIGNLCSLYKFAGIQPYVKKTDGLFKPKQGEVLIPHFLPIKYILNIYDILNNPKERM